MKRIVTMMIVVLIAATSFAAEVDSIALQPAKPKRFSFGVAAGLVKSGPICQLKGNSYDENDYIYPFEGNYGYDFGGIVRFRLSRYFHLESGLFLNDLRFSVRNYFADVAQSPVDRLEMTRVGIDRLGLRCPIKIFFRLPCTKKVSLFFACGIQFDWGIDSHVRKTFRQVDGKTWTTATNLFDKEQPEYLRRFDKGMMSRTMGVKWTNFLFTCEWLFNEYDILVSSSYRLYMNRTIYSLCYLF